MNDRFDIVVVGAGGGGAVLGLALAQRGIPVLVLERQAGAPSAAAVLLATYGGEPN